VAGVLGDRAPGSRSRVDHVQLARRLQRHRGELVVCHNPGVASPAYETPSFESSERSVELGERLTGGGTEPARRQRRPGNRQQGQETSLGGREPLEAMPRRAAFAKSVKERLEIARLPPGRSRREKPSLGQKLERLYYMKGGAPGCLPERDR
jgi:hypothetical protein